MLLGSTTSETLDKLVSSCYFSLLQMLHSDDTDTLFSCQSLAFDCDLRQKLYTEMFSLEVLIVLFQNLLDLNGQGSRRYTGKSSILHILCLTMVTGLLMCYLTTTAVMLFFSPYVQPS